MEKTKIERIDLYKLFEKVVTNYLPFIRYIVWKTNNLLCKCNLNEDAVNDGIVYFYTYHLSKFKYNEDLNYDEIFKKARNYFINRICQYYSKSNFYGKKIRKDYFGMLDNLYVDNVFSRLFLVFYTGTVKQRKDDSYESIYSNTTAEYTFNTLIDNMIKISSVDDNLYIYQFKKFIINHLKLKNKTKRKILYYMRTGSNKLFETNLTYYMNKLRELSIEFNSVRV